MIVFKKIIFLIVITVIFNSCKNSICDNPIERPDPVCPDFYKKPNGNDGYKYIRIVEVMPNPSDNIEKIRIKNYKFEGKKARHYFIGKDDGSKQKVSDLTLSNNDTIPGCETITLEFEGIDYLNNEYDKVHLYYSYEGESFTLMQTVTFRNIAEDDWITYYKE